MKFGIGLFINLSTTINKINNKYKARCIAVMSPQLPNTEKIANNHQREFIRSTTTLSSYRTCHSFSASDIGESPQEQDQEQEQSEDPASTSGVNNERRGELLSIVLPKEWQDFNMNRDESGRIDATQFDEALQAALETEQKPDLVESNQESSGHGFKFDTVLNTEHMNIDDLIVGFDLVVVHKNEDFHLHMNRNASELADRTFSRLGLSVTKRLNSILYPNRKGLGKAGYRKRKSRVRGNSAPTARLFLRQEDGGDKDVTSDEYNTKYLWEKVAVQHNSPTYKMDSIALTLSIPDPNICEHSSDESIATTTNNATELEFDVTSNPPTILDVKTFESFSSKLFNGVPIVIQTKVIHADRAQVSWFVDNELVLQDSHCFIPETEHIGKTLAVVVKPVRQGYHGKCFKEAYQFEMVIEDLPYMPIVSPLRDDFSRVERSEQERHNTIRLMTYNVLADLYVSREMDDESLMFPHVEYEYVRKARRFPMIVAEILSYNADIVCLQEVDGSIYDSYFEPVMQAMGYDAFYSNKASTQREGCATFWSRKVFEKDESLTFSLKELFDPDSTTENPKDFHRWDSMKGIKHLLRSHPELRRVTVEKIGQILQVVKLKVKHPEKEQPKKIVLANTHLFYHPMADHIRAMQTYLVCKKVDEVRRSETKHPYPLFLCGDLNSDPLSGASQLLFTRCVEPDHHDCWKHLHEYQWEMGNNDYMLEHEYIGNDVGATDLKYEEEEFQNAEESLESASNKITPPSLVLPDAFPQLVSGCEEMPKFTNYAVDFVDTLDYILASGPSNDEKYGFVPKKSAQMPIEEDVKQFVAMPNQFMPSDHVSVVADFEWSSATK